MTKTGGVSYYMWMLPSKVMPYLLRLAAPLTDSSIVHCTKVRFASSLSGGFITVIVENPPESKLAKRAPLCTGMIFWFVSYNCNL